MFTNMKRTVITAITLLISGCASFPVPHQADKYICKTKMPEAVIELRRTGDEEVQEEHRGTRRKDVLEYQNYNVESVQNLACFDRVSLITDSQPRRHENTIYFVLDSYFPNRTPESFNQHILTLVSLGIIPTWTTKRVELHVIKYSPSSGETEIAKYSHDRTNIFSIFVAPIGIYQTLRAPKGLNAADVTEIETNKFLISQAIQGMK
jgi:hypothetical protein